MSDQTKPVRAAEANTFVEGCRFIPSGSAPGLTSSIAFLSASRKAAGDYRIALAEGYRLLFPVAGMESPTNNYQVRVSGSNASQGWVDVVLSTGSLGTSVDAPNDGSVKVDLIFVAKRGSTF